MSGDHGVELSRRFSERELNSGARTYLTWSSWRAGPTVRSSQFVYQIPHPWVTYRKSKSLSKRGTASGTLVFIPHTSESTPPADFDFKEYFRSLEMLPEEFKPFSLSIQMHDVHQGLHQELAKYGYPIFTAGNSSSPFFVDRFYDLILRFNFCTSNLAGSQTFYCEEAGVPYFLYGPERLEEEQAGQDRSVYVGRDLDIIEKVRRVFSYSNLEQPSDKLEVVSQALGLDIDPETSGKTLRRKLITDVFYLAPLLTKLVLVNALSATRSFFLRREISLCSRRKQLSG